MTGKLHRRAIALALCLSASSAWAVPKAVTLPTIFRNLVPPDVEIPRKTPPCPLVVGTIADTRSDPTVIGVLGKKPIYAPDNLEAWRGSIIRSLSSRGLKLLEQSDPEAQGKAIRADFTLSRAWLTELNMNLASSVVFNMKAVAPDGTTVEAPFRGGSAKLNWASGEAELITAVETSFSRALDAMAVDLLKLCGVSAKVD